MSRFLMVSFSDSGHLNPLVAVAQHLEAAGHEVAIWSSQGDLSAKLAQADLRARFFGGRLGDAAPLHSVDFSKRMANPRWAKRFLQQTLVEVVGPLVDPLREILREQKPDVVACDSMAYAGVLAAEREGIPWAGLSTGFFAVIPPDWPTPLRETYDGIGPARNALFATHGVEGRFRVSDAISPWLNMVFTSEAVVDRALSKNDYAFHVGPTVPLGRRGDERAFSWDRIPTDRPLVYVAFGSHLSHPKEIYDTIFSALGPEEAFFVVALKSLMHEGITLPAHVLGVEYAPQLALLERACAMVNHGGANSVMESLGHGCPMMVVPLMYDQPVVGRLVQASGAGAMIEASQLTVETARAQLLALIDPDGAPRRRAREIQAALGNGAAQAAELLGRLAKERKPMTPAGA